MFLNLNPMLNFSSQISPSVHKEEKLGNQLSLAKPEFRVCVAEDVVRIILNKKFCLSHL